MRFSAINLGGSAMKCGGNSCSRQCFSD